MALKTVIHVHTDYSFDANASPREVVEAARRQSVDCVAITDHNTIAGALEAQRIGGVRVIVGEEISTSEGHVIGLFLTERIPPKLSAEHTARRIRAQGGLVFAPHPAAALCEDSLRWSTLERLRPWLDAVEVANAQNPFVWEDARARRFARRHGLPSYVGADTHVRGHLAVAYQLVPDFAGPAEFLAGLRKAALVPGRFGVGYFAVMGARHAWGLVSRRPVCGFGANMRAASRPEAGAGPAGGASLERQMLTHWPSE